MMKQTKQHHFADTSTQDLGGSFSGKPEYGLNVEKYVRSEKHGDTVYVLYSVVGGFSGEFHEYTVLAQDGDFKILNVYVYYNDPARAFLDNVAIAERQRECSADSPLVAVHDDEALLDHSCNFVDREVRDQDGETSQVKVTHAGTLITSSGVLSVRDFGWGNDDVKPLTRTVPPGTYPIDRVTAFGRNAAVRVRFDDQSPVAWCRATTAGQSENTVGVDAGCVCIVDYGAYLTMTPRDKDFALESTLKAPRPAAVQFSLADSNLDD